jgi:hypothetical protein
MTSYALDAFIKWFNNLLEKRNETGLDKNVPRDRLFEHLGPSLSYLRDVNITPVEEIDIDVD